MNHYEWSKIKFYHQSCYSWPVHHSRSSASLSSKCLVAANNGSPRAGWHTKNCSASLGKWDCMSYQLKLVPKTSCDNGTLCLFDKSPSLLPSGFFHQHGCSDTRWAPCLCLSEQGRIEFWKALWMEKRNPTDSIKRDTVLREILTWETCDMYMHKEIFLSTSKGSTTSTSISSTSTCRTASGTNANSATTHQHDRGSYCNYWVGGSD